MIPIMLITDAIGGALIGGFGSLLTGGINAIAGAVQNKRQRQHDKEMLALEDAYADENATIAYQRQLDMWNKQNAYNDPSAQMARLRNAGLNPAMIQGSNMVNQAGSMSSAPQSAGGSGKSSQAQPIRFEDSITKALSAYAQFKQLDLVDAQTKETMERVASLVLENAFHADISDDRRRSFRASVEKALEELREQRMENDLTQDAYFDDDGNVTSNPKTLGYDIAQEQLNTLRQNLSFDADKHDLNMDLLNKEISRLDNVIKQGNFTNKELENLLVKSDLDTDASKIIGFDVSYLPPYLRICANLLVAYRNRIYQFDDNTTVGDYRRKKQEYNDYLNHFMKLVDEYAQDSKHSQDPDYLSSSNLLGSLVNLIKKG